MRDVCRKLFASVLAGCLAAAAGPASGMAFAADPLFCEDGVPGLKARVIVEERTAEGVPLVLKIRNRSGQDLTDVAVTQEFDGLLAGMEVVGGPDAAGGDADLTGDGSLSWTGDLAKGEAVAIEYTVVDPDFVPEPDAEEDAEAGAEESAEENSDEQSQQDADAADVAEDEHYAAFGPGRTLKPSTTSTSAECGRPDAEEPAADQDTEPAADTAASDEPASDEPVRIAEGTFATAITNVQISLPANPTMCLQAESAASGSLIFTRTCNSSQTLQRWNVTTDDQLVLNQAPTLCLENPGGVTTSNHNVALTSSCASGGGTNTWPYRTSANGSIPAGTFYNTASGLCLNVRGGVIIDRQLLAYTCSNPSANETFSVGSADMAVVPQTVDVKPGGTASTNLRITNSGPQSSYTNSLTATIDPALTFAYTASTYAATNAYTSCTSTATTLTCPAANGVAWVGTTTGTSTPTGYVGFNATVPANAAVGSTYTVCGTTKSGITSDPATANNTGCTTIRVVPFQSDLSALAGNTQATTTTVTPGTTATLDFTVADNGPDVAGVPKVTFALPSGATAATLTGPAGWTCSTTALTCTGPTETFASGATAAFSLAVAVDSGIAAGTTIGDVTATTSVSGRSVDSVATNNTATDTLQVSADVTVDVAKTGTATADPGDFVTYTITVANDGTATVNGIRVADQIPAGLSGGTWTCDSTGGTCGTRLGNGDIDTTVDLPAGASATFTLVATVDASAGGTNVVNTASVTVPGALANNGTAQDSATTAVNLGDIEVAKTVDNAAPAPGAAVTYTVVLTNSNPSAVTVDLTDGLSAVAAADPTGMGATASDGSSVAAPTYAAASQTLSWSGAVPAAGSVTLTYTVATDPSAAEGSTAVNSVTAADTNCAAGAQNDDCTATITFSAAQVDLSTTKVPTTTDPVAPGGTFAYALTAANAGPSDAVNATATDELPTALRFVSGGGCAAAGQTVTCGPQATLAAGESHTWTITVMLDPGYTGDGSDIANTATASSDTEDPNSGNDTSDPNSDIDGDGNRDGGLPGGDPAAGEADLSTTKQAQGTGPITPGGTFDYLITVTNAGPSDAVNATATDELPGELSFVSGAGCTPNGQTVTCGPEATLAAGQSKSWTITVRLDPGYTGDGSDIANTATSSSDTADPNPDNDGSDPDADDDGDGNRDGGLPGGDPADPSADLSTTKQAQGTGPVAPGETFDYLITVSNAGPSDAVNATATDDLPTALSFVSGAGCTPNGQTVTCGPEATLAAGASKSWTITVKLDSGYTGDGSDIANTATASSDTTDPNSDNDGSDPNSDDDGDGNRDGGLPGGDAGDASADLSTTKAAQGTGPVTPGGTFDYLITVTNNGPSDAVNATATDDLPSQLSFVSGADCTPNGQTVTCGPEAILAAGQSKSWTITVRLDPGYTGDGSDIANTATASSDTTDPNSDNDGSDPNSDDDGDGNRDGGLPGGDPADPSADLATTKQAQGSGPVAPGETFDYLISVTNNGPSTAVNARATDELPSQLSFVSGADCTPNGQTVTCGPESTLAAGATKSWTITVRLDPGYTGDGSDISNTATGSSDTADPNPDNDGSDPDADSDGDGNKDGGLPGGDSADPSADLSTTKQAQGTGPIAPGETFDYVISVTNDGPSTAVNAKAVDELPSQLSFVSGAGCTPNGQTVTCGPEATLAAGQSKSWTITVRLDPAYTGDGSDISNTATGSSDMADPNPDNDGSDPDADSDGDGNKDGGLPGGDSADPSADLSTTKQAQGTGPVAPGGTFDYVITVSNAGPSDAVNATATDDLPTALSFVSGDGCSPSGQTVTCGPEATLAAGQSKSWTITVKLDPAYTGDGSDISNTATASSDTTDPNSDNDGSDPNADDDGDGNKDGGLPGGDSADPSADLSTTKQAQGTGPVTPGGTFDYLITVTNNGPSDAVNAKATDELPSQLSFVSGAGCTPNGQTVTCGPEAILAAGQSKSWTVTVKLDPAYTGDGSDISNTATGSSDTTDPNSDNDGSDPDADDDGDGNKDGGLPGGDSADPSADLSTTKQALNDPGLAPGDAFDYRTTVTNNGPSNAVNVTATDELPTGLTFVSGAGCTATGQTVTCGPQATLAVGAQQSWTFTVRIDADYTGDGSDLGNIMVASSDTADPNPDNDANPAPGALPNGDVHQRPVINGATGTGTSKPTFNGTGEPGSTVTVNDENGDPVCIATVGSDGTWTCQATKPIPDGSHEFTPSQTGSDGGTVPGKPVKVVIDTDPPAKPGNIKVIDGPGGDKTVSGTGEPGSTVNVTGPDGPVCTATVAEDGTWSCSGPVTGGPISVTQTDEDGNTSGSVEYWESDLDVALTLTPRIAYTGVLEVVVGNSGPMDAPGADLTVELPEQVRLAGPVTGAVCTGTTTLTCEIDERLRAGGLGHTPESAGRAEAAHVAEAAAVAVDTVTITVPLASAVDCVSSESEGTASARVAPLPGNNDRLPGDNTASADTVVPAGGENCAAIVTTGGDLQSVVLVGALLTALGALLTIGQWLQYRMRRVH